MQLVYKSEKIDDPTVNLVVHMRNKVIDNVSVQDIDKYIIRLGGVLFNVLENEQLPPFPQTFKGIKYIEDNSIEDGCYCIYRKDKQAKAKDYPNLNEWFNNLPLYNKARIYVNCNKPRYIYDTEK